MAIHRFICYKCNGYIEDTTTKGIHKCPKCDEEMALDCHIAIHGNYKHPVHSDSLAISPDQVEEHKRLFPDIEIDSEGRPVFDNFTRHEKYLKQTGFKKMPQKLRRTGAVRIT